MESIQLVDFELFLLNHKGTFIDFEKFRVCLNEPTEGEHVDFLIEFSVSVEGVPVDFRSQLIRFDPCLLALHAVFLLPSLIFGRDILVLFDDCMSCIFVVWRNLSLG
jgi:hypothetical protein